MNASSSKVVPLVSSGTKGPMGALHLPRLWLKLSLGSRNMLADGYDVCGQGFDQMTLTGLGLDKEKTLAFIREKHPTYMQFEEYVAAQHGGTVPADLIAKHNAAIAGYNHGEDDGKSMRSESGISNHNVKDAVTLNTVNDLDELHKQMHARG
jgi:hypothetical protein